MPGQTRVAVFVDGANLFYAQGEMGWVVGLRQLLEYIDGKYGVVEDAYYYIGKGTPPEEKQQKFLNSISYSGYTLITKTLKTIRDDDGIVKQKANLDIEIVLDMFNTIDNYDLAVLVSGDGDFDRALQLLRARGKRFIVMSTDAYIARELRNTAGRHYINIESLKDELWYRDLDN